MKICLGPHKNVSPGPSVALDELALDLRSREWFKVGQDHRC